MEVAADVGIQGMKLWQQIKASSPYTYGYVL